MLITHKPNTKCIADTKSIIIKLLNNNQIAIAHCCLREKEIVNPISLADFYKMDNITFWDYLQKSYKKIPENHKYEPDYYCNTKQLCFYNDKYINKVAVSTFRHCNIHCKMCLVSSNNYLPYNEEEKLYFNILEKLKGHNLEIIELTSNGEPFLSKEKTFNYLENLRPNIDCQTIEIVSNLTLLNSNDILRLKKIADNGLHFNFMASCSAITEETYRKIHNNNNFNKVINNIIELNQLGLLTRISFVIQNENLHELEFLHDFWKSKNINTNLQIRYVIGSGGEQIAKLKIYDKYIN